MRGQFPRTARGFERDGFTRTLIALLLGVGLIVAWSAWFFLARVTVYEVSASARLEADRAAHPIDAPVAGRVVESRLVLGREVEAGASLVSLEIASEQRAHEEAQRRHEALGPQLESIRGEIATRENALDREQQAAEAALAEGRSRFREADIAAQLAAKELKREIALRADGLSSDSSLDHKRAAAEGTRATAESLRLAVERLEAERATASQDREALLEQLRREEARLEGELRTAEATVARLATAIEERVIRAPADGRIVEAADLEAGSFLQEGDRLGMVLGSGELKGVAEIAPSAAGRVKSGQGARLRFDGYPSAQYGTLAARVVHVASELRDGQVRVELAIDPASNPALPLQHGLPASVEIEIERVSPAVLVLRGAGKLLTGPRENES